MNISAPEKLNLEDGKNAAKSWNEFIS